MPSAQIGSKSPHGCGGAHQSDSVEIRRNFNRLKGTLQAFRNISGRHFWPGDRLGFGPFSEKVLCYTPSLALSSTSLCRCTFGNSIGAPQAAPHERRLGGFLFIQWPSTNSSFHWSNRASGAGPRSRSQGRFEIAGNRTRTDSGVCSDVSKIVQDAKFNQEHKCGQIPFLI